MKNIKNIVSTGDEAVDVKDEDVKSGERHVCRVVECVWGRSPGLLAAGP